MSTTGDERSAPIGRPEVPEPPEEPVLPRKSRDERGIGWGDDPREGQRDAEWYRRERPPHHE